ncbi:Ark- serine/threonine protein kinase [Ceratocystis pirilliformis]|uniref:non-specific serine/threonine protein kinase n=1 Tax=Ceratocystis pirilliformis TaxID=259994 RepID=A0ABR3ZBS3_9PEZI
MASAPSNHVQMHLPMGASQPPGTFSPGTKIQVGSHRVIIQKYLSEGGFAHVYLVKLPMPVDGTDMAVLKRVAVPDKDTLRGMRTEVETMKRLKGHKPIVTYIDSHASEMKGGGYEVFLLMEFCNGGGLIDFMNTRLQHRLTEPEILKIFSDVAEGVACMHYLKPALLHRDLKVENVLITNRSDGSKRFKVCDFGSVAPPRPAPKTVAECRQIDDDIQRHTTLQYRSPEMVDVYRMQPIDEKSDIWALGVLLYKLCYYTTPFEDQGQLAILNASLRFPSYPQFSDRLRNLIAAMLREAPSSRPNIYQVLKEACRMQGCEVPIHDIYSASSLPDKNSQIKASVPTPDHKPAVGVSITHQAPVQQALPEIVPMRRGRPTSCAPVAATMTPAGVSHTAKRPSPSPMRVISGDPFAALDSTKTSTAIPAAAAPPSSASAPPKLVAKPPSVLSPPANMESADELSVRFPTLDQFSLLHDQGNKFDFDSDSPRNLDQRVTEKLVDEAFAYPLAKPTSSASVEPPRQRPEVPSTPASVKPSASAGGEMSKAHAIIARNPELEAISSHASSAYLSSSQGMTAMVSVGTMTTGDLSTSRPIIHRYATATDNLSAPVKTALRQSTEDLHTINVAKSSGMRSSSHNRMPSSSRPSLEVSRPQPPIASADLLDVSPPSRSTSARPRPVSTHLESNMEFLREKERERASMDRGSRRSLDRSSRRSLDKSRPSQDIGGEDLEYLRNAMEYGSKKPKSNKRSSLSLSGTKNILAGKFGDAFKRFESHHHSSPFKKQAAPRSPSPKKDLHDSVLTPIAGSEATDGRSDDGQNSEDEQDMTPEMRREFERLQLAEEERRVEAAQVEYRRRLTERKSGSLMSPSSDTGLPKSIGGVSRAVSIQNRVQSLLGEEQRNAPVQRTAQGYGRYTESAEAAPSPQQHRGPTDRPPAETLRKPVRTMTSETQLRVKNDLATGGGGSAARPPLPPKPVAPRKPGHLNGMPTGRSASPTKGLAPAQPIMATNSLATTTGKPESPGTGPDPNYLSDFSKRFPSLSAIEMVDMDLDKK